MTFFLKHSSYPRRKNFQYTLLLAFLKKVSLLFLKGQRHLPLMGLFRLKMKLKHKILRNFKCVNLKLVVKQLILFHCFQSNQSCFSYFSQRLFGSSYTFKLTAQVGSKVKRFLQKIMESNWVVWPHCCSKFFPRSTQPAKHLSFQPVQTNCHHL